MTRINPVNYESSQGETRELLDAVKAKIGGTPNMILTLAKSPAVLKSYLGLGQALSSASLSAGLQEQIAVAVAQSNSCEYCTSAHTVIGKSKGVSADELALNLNGDSADPKTKAALDFANAVVNTRGFASDEQLAEVRAAGYTDGEVLEIVAVVVANILTNYVAHVAEPEIDFPIVKVNKSPEQSAACAC